MADSTVKKIDRRICHFFIYLGRCTSLAGIDLEIDPYIFFSFQSVRQSVQYKIFLGKNRVVVSVSNRSGIVRGSVKRFFLLCCGYCRYITFFDILQVAIGKVYGSFAIPRN